MERWFGFITHEMIRRGNHTSVQSLEADIRAWTLPRTIDPGPVLGIAREQPEELPPSLDPVNDPPPSGLTPTLVTALQSVQGYPCISLLLTTRPGARMDRSDAERLERLRLNAISRLRAEHLLDAEQETVASLDRLVQEAMSRPTDRAVTLFANREFARTVNLTVEVEDWAVIDPTFPPETSSGRCTAPLGTPSWCSHGTMQPSTTAPAAGWHRHREPASRCSSRPRSTTPTTRSVCSPLFERWIEPSASTFGCPAPLVVVGPQKAVTAFTSRSGNLSRLAGTVYGNFDDVSVAELARRTRPALNNYLRSREHAALTQVHERSSAHRVASGIATAWLAASTERPEMLAVEESYRYPARLSADGDLVTPADDVEAPDVIDDLVDELIETVLDRGGWIALIRDGSLTEHSKVALTLR